MNDQHRRITTHDLSAELLADATDQRFTKGLPTGDNTADGSITYHMTFWHYPYRARSGQVFYIPAMRGYGGNIQLLLPNGMSACRIGNDTVTKNPLQCAVIRSPRGQDSTVLTPRIESGSTSVCFLCIMREMMMG